MYNKPKAILSLLALSIWLYSCGSNPRNPRLATQALQTQNDSVSYAFGVMNAQGFGKLLKTLPGDTLNKKQILRAFAEILEGKETAINAETAQEVFRLHIKRIQEQQDKQHKAQNDSVLQANQSKPGVITTESGLQYRVLKAGTGKQVNSEQDTVVVHYIGKLIDGKVFDSSYERQQPGRFAVGEVIEGWTEALKLMQVGAKYELYIPSKLAYKEQGAGDAIPPHATLIFEIELLQVVPHEAQRQDTTATQREQQEETSNSKNSRGKRQRI